MQRQTFISGTEYVPGASKLPVIHGPAFVKLFFINPCPDRPRCYTHPSSRSGSAAGVGADAAAEAEVDVVGTVGAEAADAADAGVDVDVVGGENTPEAAIVAAV